MLNVFFFPWWMNIINLKVGSICGLRSAIYFHPVLFIFHRDLDHHHWWGWRWESSSTMIPPGHPEILNGVQIWAVLADCKSDASSFLKQFESDESWHCLHGKSPSLEKKQSIDGKTHSSEYSGSLLTSICCWTLTLPTAATLRVVD